MREECGAVIEPRHLKKVANIDFEFEGDPVVLEVHVFMAEKYSGSSHAIHAFNPEVLDCIML